MRRSTTALMATGLVGALFIAAPSFGGPGFNNKYSDDPQTVECKDSEGNTVGSVIYGGPLYLWPPNHKQQAITVTSDAVDADDDVTIATEGTHDEYAEDGTEMNGAGNTTNDVEPATDSGGPAADTASTEHALRSERSGRGDGRTYTLDWQATFTDSDGDQGYGEVVCGSADIDESGFEPNEDAFLVNVPHDMRGGAGWKHDEDGDGDGDRGNNKNDRNDEVEEG